MGKIKFLIADSQYLVVESLKHILENDFNMLSAGIVSNSNELEINLHKIQIDMLIADSVLILDDNSLMLKNIRVNFPGIPIMVLTNGLSKTEVNELIKNNIKTIVYKNIDREEFRFAMEATLNKKKFFSGEVIDLLTEQTITKRNSGNATLTTSELEIVKLIAGGMTTKEIANKKNISFHTVISHRKNIFKKLSINNSSELIMFAIRKGLIDSVDYSI